MPCRTRRSQRSNYNGSSPDYGSARKKRRRGNFEEASRHDLNSDEDSDSDDDYRFDERSGEWTMKKKAGRKAGSKVNKSYVDYCVLCEDGGDLLMCDGPCLRSFHLQCLGLTSVPTEGECCAVAGTCGTTDDFLCRAFAMLLPHFLVRLPCFLSQVNGVARTANNTNTSA